MKIKKLMGLTLASVLILSGCSSTVKDNGKDVVASIDDKNILADDVYTSLSSSTSGQNSLFTFLITELVKTNFPVTSDMKENANDIITNIETGYKNQYGDEADTQLQSALASSGFKNLAAYKDSVIYSLQYSEFLKKYVKDNFDTVFEDYYKQEAPRFISLIKITMTDVDNPTDDEKAKLDEVKSLLKTDKNFADIASEYSDDNSASAKGNIGVVDSTAGLSSTYGSDVEKEALALESGKTTDAIKGTGGYYFLYCSSNDKDKIKTELKTVDIDSPLLVYDDYMVYLVFNTYEMKYANEDIEKQVKKIVDESLKTRDEQRGGKS